MMEILGVVGAVVGIVSGLWGLTSGYRRRTAEKIASLYARLAQLHRKLDKQRKQLDEQDRKLDKLGKQLAEQDKQPIKTSPLLPVVAAIQADQSCRLARLENVTDEALDVERKIDSRISGVEGYLRGLANLPLDAEPTSTSH